MEDTGTFTEIQSVPILYCHHKHKCHTQTKCDILSICEISSKCAYSWTYYLVINNY